MKHGTQETEVKVDLVQIDEARINDVCDNYFKWKSLNDSLRNFCSRGLNLPDAISEPIGCYALGYFWNKGTGGDAEKPDGSKVEFKATSNFEYDLTSFGPKIDFKDLVFLRLDYDANLMYIYDTGLSATEIAKIQVNKTQTVADQQRIGRRPHVRLIESLINARGLQPTCVFNIRKCITESADAHPIKKPKESESLSIADGSVADDDTKK
jgi:hypothetical protein